MSFISKIEGAEHTFAAWAEKELTTLSKDAPAITKVADSILKYVGGALEIVVGLEAGAPAAAEVTAAVNTAQAGVTALNGLISDYGATPTAATVASSIATNLAPILTAAKVSNPVSVAAVTAVVSNLTTLATALTASSTTATAK